MKDWLAAHWAALMHRVAVATSEDDDGKVASSARWIAFWCMTLATAVTVRYCITPDVTGAAMLTALVGGGAVAIWKRSSQ